MPRSRIMSTSLDRRRILGGLTGTAALLGLSACGVSESSDSNKGDKSDKKGEGAGDGGARSVKTDDGTVEVPRKAERVVVTDNYAALMLLELGLVPVGVPDGTAVQTLMPEKDYARLKDVKTVGAAGTPNSQAIATLKPDLIIDQFYRAKTKPLGDIAPVAFFDWGTSGALWHEQVAKVARAVGREDELTGLKKRYETRLKEVRTKYRKQIATSTWAPLSGGPSGKFFLGTPLVTVMREVGLKIGAGLPDDEAGFVTRSYEEIDVLDDCTALIYPVQFDGKPTPTTKQLLDQKLWKKVPAVKAGRAFTSKHFLMPNYTFALGAVDEIEGMLQKL
ncbi:ABC transporter substrate-binding protein [Streptomyces sp. p1417]|uniref:ABC transporter substrate-binding protein n=1 Tax=Streptomyces typhae TaxID=2681492 RepID=A0A6L6X4S8_9ACTN|nr:ABC transporter substrate-binding protein [Streptomyces typhae]